MEYGQFDLFHSTETPVREIAKAVYPFSFSPKPEEIRRPQEADYRNADGGFDYEAYDRDYEKWRQWRESRWELQDFPGAAEVRERPKVTAKETAKLAPFFRKSAARFLQGDENRVYAPMNIYMALAMLSGVTAGNSRKQILNLLGAKTPAALAKQANRFWNALCANDSLSTVLLGSSLWLNEKIRFNADTLKQLSETFYASFYAGEMGSPAFDAALQTWLNEQTRGLLSKQVNDVELSSATLLALATTVYFKSNWESQFEEGDTMTRDFYAESGKRKAFFMRQTYAGNYYTGFDFSAVCKELQNGEMWLILPSFDPPADLLARGEVMDFLCSPQKYVTSTNVDIELSLPKFDVSTDLDLIGGLEALGVTDVFDSAVSDFSPMTGRTQDIAITKAQHAARVRIDEKGCEAAAFTLMEVEITGFPPPPLPRIKFTLNRPFLFAVTVDNLPLFVGVVQEPLNA